MDRIIAIITYILGAAAGLAVGFIVLSFTGDMRAMLTLPLLTAGFFIGVIATIVVRERERHELERKNNMKRDETIAIITHEMRTSLTSTSWVLELIMSTYKDALKNEDKEMLKRSVDAIQTTVMHSVNLLDITMLDMGKLKVMLEWTTLDSISTILNDTVLKFSQGAKNKGIALYPDIHLDSVTKMQADPIRLRVILENLLENALQYTVLDKKEIRITSKNDADNLFITVADTGIGIPKVEQEKIFSQFFRAENARKVLSSGSGIGLSLCKEYVTAHQGTIRFESKEGEGTTFFITIPLKTTAHLNEFFVKV